MYLLLNCNLLVTIQTVIDFVVTQELAKWVESQIQDTWKEIYLNRLLRLTFNISSQLINNLLWRFMILFQYPTLILEQNVVTRIFESLNPSSSKWCLVTSNSTSLIWTHSFWLTSKLSVSLSFEAFQVLTCAK